MAEKKTDLRVVKTQEAIRRAYLELLRTHTAKEITVTELCRLARINRGTFTCITPTPTPCWSPSSAS